jgi:hypothetical protein
MLARVPTITFKIKNLAPVAFAVYLAKAYLTPTDIEIEATRAAT